MLTVFTPTDYSLLAVVTAVFTDLSFVFQCSASPRVSPFSSPPPLSLYDISVWACSLSFTLETLTGFQLCSCCTPNLDPRCKNISYPTNQLFFKKLFFSFSLLDPQHLLIVPLKASTVLVFTLSGFKSNSCQHWGTFPLQTTVQHIKKKQK